MTDTTTTEQPVLVPIATAARLLRLSREQAMRRVFKGTLDGQQDPKNRYWYITGRSLQRAMREAGLVPTTEAMQFFDPRDPLPNGSKETTP